MSTSHTLCLTKRNKLCFCGIANNAYIEPLSESGYPPQLIHYVLKNSKWVWSGNTTITNRRQPCGTARKSRSTTTKHQEDKLSKATGSLFPIKMIAILERTQSNVQQKRSLVSIRDSDWVKAYILKGIFPCFIHFLVSYYPYFTVWLLSTCVCKMYYAYICHMILFLQYNN